MGGPVGDGVMAGKGISINEETGTWTEKGSILPEPGFGGVKATRGNEGDVADVEVGFEPPGVGVGIERTGFEVGRGGDTG